MKNTFAGGQGREDWASNLPVTGSKRVRSDCQARPTEKQQGDTMAKDSYLVLLINSCKVYSRILIHSLARSFSLDCFFDLFLHSCVYSCVYSCFRTLVQRSFVYLFARLLFRLLFPFVRTFARLFFRPFVLSFACSLVCSAFARSLVSFERLFLR